MKTCLICQATKPYSDFSSAKSGRLGLHPWCRECVSSYNKARYHTGQNPSTYVRKSQAKIPKVVIPELNQTRLKDASPGFRAAEKVWRKLLEKNRIPPWVSLEDVLPIYEAAARAKYFTVDHIVPLHGKNVSGLHVPWNLQLLTPSENSKKGARFSVS